MSIEWNKVTWYSKFIAIILFCGILALGVYFGGQVQELKDATNYSQNTTTILTPHSTAKDSKSIYRIPLTTGLARQLFGYTPTMNCQDLLNVDDPTMQVLYTNILNGVSAEIPYNPNWGNDAYQVTPYEDASSITNDTTIGGIQFGPIYGPSGEGCSEIDRNDSLSATTLETVSDLEKDIGKVNTEKLIAVKKINGFDVVEYETSEFATTETLVIVGTKFDYELSNYGDMPELENIAQTVKLLQ